MKEFPMLFSTPMVKAINEDRKSQTRRIIKIPDLIEYPHRFKYQGNSTQFDIPREAIPYDDRLYHSWELVNSNEYTWVIHSYKPGDVLWVKETYYAFGHWTLITTTNRNSVTKQWHFNDLTLSGDKRYLYEDCAPSDVLKGRFGLGYFKRPSIFMPKKACRIKLLIKDIRVERLQDITKDENIEDIAREGIDKSPFMYYDTDENGDILKDFDTEEFKEAYQELWESINGKNSWNLNPWVWVIEFEKIKN